ncbi:uncharacterized protein LOC115891370 isoform X2 [Sitophilus oryzae]|uniref:Uncharacterized protein LOC115891370 isoform X2 n=1 Tax=Sitophilus oryzae TaxID=7048 RepID=A0A6J2YU89_SITOR|nr:uncharacterized protein LOC115891370 isoform X2 [Sitophilus oryzae]
MEGEIYAFLNEPFNYRELHNFLGTRRNIQERREANNRGIKLLEHFSTIPNRNVEIDCINPGCNLQMKAHSDRTIAVGWRFCCPANHKISATNNTFLHNVRLREIGADRIVEIIAYWLDQQPLDYTIAETKIATDTAVAWYKYCRDVARKVAWHNFRQIGGPQDIVEVDETHLTKRKYNIGRHTAWRHCWVFGGTSRTSKKVFATTVEDRSANTLLPIMQQFIDHETFICSDEWRAYGLCNQLFSGHGTVNHSVNFLNPARDDDPLWMPAGRFHENCLDEAFNGPVPNVNMVPIRYHTQNIERQWRALKTIFKRGSGITYADDYIGEWMYRTNDLSEVNSRAARFEMFCRDIARAYPGPGRRGARCPQILLNAIATSASRYKSARN